MTDQYKALGVDADKRAVGAVFAKGVRNDFPGAFINIICSRVHPGWVKTQHSDGDGSKIILRLLMYFLTKDDRWLSGLVDDGWSMNFGDGACGGFVAGEFMVTDTVNLNQLNVPKELLLKVIAQRTEELVELYGRYGIGHINFDSISLLGGETGDLPRQVQTAVFDITVSGDMREEGVIRGNVGVGDQIWGFGSDGKAAWETMPNSGIMSNGLTLAVNTLISGHYIQQFPQLLIAGNTFQGAYLVNSPSGIGTMTIAEALLSPTRHWAILIKILIDKLKKSSVLHFLHGMSMNTGGGATKIRNVGTGGILYRKTMPLPPEIFRLIQTESKEIWENMFRSFNCGIGLDIIGDARLAPFLEEVEQETGVRLHKLGACESATIPVGNQVELDTPFGYFAY